MQMFSNLTIELNVFLFIKTNNNKNTIIVRNMSLIDEINITLLYSKRDTETIPIKWLQ